MKTHTDYHPQKELEETSRSCPAEIVPYQLLHGILISITAILSFFFFNLCLAQDRVMIFGN